jgi:hypothetical protein
LARMVAGFHSKVRPGLSPNSLSTMPMRNAATTALCPARRHVGPGLERAQAGAINRNF